MRSRILRGAVVVLAMLVMTGRPLAADGVSTMSPEEAATTRAEIRSRLVEVEHTIRESVERIRSAGAEFQALARDMRPQIEEMDGLLDHLEMQLADDESSEGLAIVAKVESLRLLVSNLDTARSAGEPPPRLGPLAIDVVAPEFRAAPGNDACDAALTVGAGTVVGTTAGATNDGSATCGASIDSPDVWFRYVPPTTGKILVNTFGSDFDTVLSAHSACPGMIGNQITCNDDNVGLQAAISVDGVAGEAILLRLSGVAGATGGYALEIGEGAVIEGSVTRESNGAPLSNVYVTSWNASHYSTFGDYSDADGAYQIQALQPGDYVVGALPYTPFGDELYDNVACPDGPPTGCSFDDGTIVPASFGATTAGIDLSLALTGTLVSGTVREASSGTQLACSSVAFYTMNGTKVRSISTGTDGAWSAYGLPTGTYVAIGSHSGYESELYDERPCGGGIGVGCEVTDGTPFVVSPGSEVTGVDFTLAVSGTISGSVVNANTGVGISYQLVSARNLSGVEISWDRTSSDGSYSISNLPPGSYYVVAPPSSTMAGVLYDGVSCPDAGCDLALGTPVQVATAADTSGIDFSLVPRGVIRGRVTVAGTAEPAGSVLVRAWDPAGFSVTSDWTNSSGEYVLDGIDPGTYFVAISQTSYFFEELYDDLPCAGGPPSGCDVAAGTPVAVADGVDALNIDFELIPRPTISGTVTDVVTSQPVGGISIHVHGPNGSVRYATSGNDGTYRVTLPESGTYTVGTFGAKNHGYIDELFDNVPCPGGIDVGCPASAGTPIEVGLAPVPGVDLTLSPMGRITGLVLDDPSGVAVQSVRVVAWTEAASKYKTASSDADGRYVISGLPAGSYWVSTEFAAPRVDELYSDVECMLGVGVGCNLGDGTPVVVASGGETTGIDFSLAEGGTISGVVVETATGSTLSSATVRVWAQDGESVRVDSTDGLGAYAITGLAPGSYYVTAAKSGYEGEVYDGVTCHMTYYETCDVTVGTPVLVTSGGTTGAIDFSLDRLGSVHGLVVDSVSGLAVDHARVALYDAAGDTVDTDTTTATGEYSVSARGGTYFAAVYSASGHARQLWNGHPISGDTFDPTAGDPIVVQAGTSIRHVDFRLPPTATIRGMVFDADDAVPASATVVLFDADGVEVESTGASSYSGYVFDNLAAGVYFIGTRSSSTFIDQVYDGLECLGGAGNGCDPQIGTPVVVGVGDDVTIDFTLRPVGRVIGTVRRASDGSVVPSIHLAIWSQAGALIAQRTTASDGTYHIDGLEAGTYFIGMSVNHDYVEEMFDNVPCSGGAPDGCAPTSGSPVIVSLGSVHEVDFEIDMRGVITGQVIAADSGSPLGYFGVDAYSLADLALVSSSASNSAGQYEIRGLPPGSYLVVTDGSSSYKNELYDDVPCSDLDCDTGLGTPVPAQLNLLTTGIDFTLEPCTGAISGRVTDAASGAPIRQIQVVVFDASGHQRDYDYTSSTGSYSFPHLEAGRYFVVIDYASGYIPELYDDMSCWDGPPYGCDPTKGTPIDVVEGTVDGIDFALDSVSYGVHGVVTQSASGLPLSGAYVDAWSHNGYHVATAIVGPGGDYFLKLYPGQFFLSTDSGADFVEEVYDDIACPGGPAYSGGCDPMLGDSIEVLTGHITDGVDFALDRDQSAVFVGDFESGGFSEWSSVVGSGS